METLTVDDDLLAYGKVGIGSGGIHADDDAASLVLYGKLLVYVAALVVGDDTATDADAILDFNSSILGAEVVLAVFLFQLADVIAGKSTPAKTNTDTVSTLNNSGTIRQSRADKSIALTLKS